MLLNAITLHQSWEACLTAPPSVLLCSMVNSIRLHAMQTASYVTTAQHRALQESGGIDCMETALEHGEDQSLATPVLGNVFSDNPLQSAAAHGHPSSTARHDVQFAMLGIIVAGCCRC